MPQPGPRQLGGVPTLGRPITFPANTAVHTIGLQRSQRQTLGAPERFDVQVRIGRGGKNVITLEDRYVTIGEGGNGTAPELTVYKVDQSWGESGEKPVETKVLSHTLSKADYDQLLNEAEELLRGPEGHRALGFSYDISGDPERLGATRIDRR